MCIRDSCTDSSLEYRRASSSASSITTAPSVRYRVTATNGELIEVDNPTKFPDPSNIKHVEEPIILATVITREEYLGGILSLLEEKRGEQKKFEHIGSGRVLLEYELPRCV